MPSAVCAGRSVCPAGAGSKVVMTIGPSVSPPRRVCAVLFARGGVPATLAQSPPSIQGGPNVSGRHNWCELACRELACRAPPSGQPPLHCYLLAC